ncbi:MAG: hypothetical protein RM022_025170, partial [Nostoc sp. EfeVER01]|uniref:hypothetical protein n=1 Tax=Nostoc sp. EfeVER01 TaxID=3075406 RepID=UPI002AD39AA9
EPLGLLRLNSFLTFLWENRVFLKESSFYVIFSLSTINPPCLPASGEGLGVGVGFRDFCKRSICDKVGVKFDEVVLKLGNIKNRETWK